MKKLTILSIFAAGALMLAGCGSSESSDANLTSDTNDTAHNYPSIESMEIPTQLTVPMVKREDLEG